MVFRGGKRAWRSFASSNQTTQHGCDMTVPRMFDRGEPTNTLKTLREIAKSTEGIAPASAHPRLGVFPAAKTRAYIASNLLKAGWIEIRNSGPRGGKRLFITEMGQHVLDMIDKDGVHYVRSLWLAYPEMLAEMRKLGIDPEESF
jgi:hypothetical protein